MAVTFLLGILHNIEYVGPSSTCPLSHDSFIHVLFVYKSNVTFCTSQSADLHDHSQSKNGSCQLI
ncbi:unnamed protein product [Periconia digitata]|uniref:Uncharacterized protein n=1 Tax=Periconia digitata TaxID=1303443 RepID=A0A9W4UAG4_9PLEO|nr:unnamed protein product [Periconia digitata]